MNMKLLVWHGTNYIKKVLYSVIPLKIFIPIPSNIYIVPSKRCNAKCIMCLNWREKNPKELSLKIWKKTIDELARIAPYSKVNISGGEILLPGLLREIAFYAVKKLPYTGIVTNGFLLDKKMVKKVVAAGFSNVNISVDGNTEKTVNMIRGREYAFKTSLLAMELLTKEIKKSKSHTKVIIKPIVMGLNFHELPDLVCKAKKIGLQGVYFQPIEPIYNSKQTFEELKKSALWIQQKDKVKALDIINKLIKMKKEGYPIINEVSNLEELKDYFELRERDQKVQLKHCEIDLANLFLLFNGDITFCGSFPAIGNIRRTQIQDTLTSPFAQLLRRRIRNCGKIDVCKSTCKINKSIFQQARLFFMLNR
ncbi:MAG: radical SAM protein [Candidatus Roizmanbacteria bacterium]|nr:radical SAM protein [Candidatus Roizmanbacteria bacterium]